MLKYTDLIIFNSKDCYNKYSNKIKNSKYIILNNVPDIKINNLLINPQKKKNLNIGILGRVGSMRKGKQIIIKIFNLLKNKAYKFYVFGCKSYIKHPNITFFESYDNNNIYNLIKENDIDLFLFTSVVEETYSYVLSIEMNTGLPIIYYNKGCIDERIGDRNNCYKFNNCNEVANILNKLNLDDISNKLNYKYEIESYNCEYNYLFNIERQIQIDNNNNSKILITLVNDNNNCNIINDLNDLIINYDTCYILLIGKHIKFSNNFKLVYYNEDITNKNIMNCVNYKSTNKNIKNKFIYYFNNNFLYYKDELNNSLKLDKLKKLNKYINCNNFNKAKNIVLNSENVINISQKYLDILLDIKRKINSNKKTILFISECIYPPAGGGEHWILDSAEILNDYNNILICFKDNFINKKFNGYKYLDYNGNHIIQLEYNIIDILTIINYFNIDTIIHQGHLRKNVIDISVSLNINLITFFAFWNDLIDFNNNSNVNMINNEYQKTELFINNYDKVHFVGVSKFVNDICYNTYNKNIEIINSITKINDNIKLNVGKYVTFLNSHPLKGGNELYYLLHNLNFNIPIYAILTENNSNFDKKLISAFKFRNKKKNINKYFSVKKNIKEIYENTNIMMILSSVDETFCRVAYESIILNKKVINYNNGNLKYIFEEYKNNYPVDLDLNKINNSNKEYKNIKNLIEEIYNKDTNEYYNKEKYENDIQSIKLKYNNLIDNPKINNKNTIGIYGPFIDQGLGIQMREYYTFLKQHNYNVVIYNHKTNHSSISDVNEWKDFNKFDSNYTRHNLIIDEIIYFVNTYNIKVIIIPEVCFEIIKTIKYFNLLNVKIITPINIECLRYNELNNYQLIDTIVANNESSYLILNQLLYNKVKLLEFDNYYLNKCSKSNKLNDTIKFCCFGGVNSFHRKNIDKIYNVFKNIEIHNINFELNIYIQSDKNKKINELKNTKILK